MNPLEESHDAGRLRLGYHRAPPIHVTCERSVTSSAGPPPRCARGPLKVKSSCAAMLYPALCERRIAKPPWGGPWDF
jgi:hypothetical protein